MQPERPHPAGSIEISVVVPVLNEADSLAQLVEELHQALSGWEYEVVFVDDGSTDATVERMQHLHAADPRVKLVRLRQHYGKTAALMAGFYHSRGEVVITMDGDLQDVPAEVPKLVAALEENRWDLACAWRAQRQDSFAKRMQSKLFNWAVQRFAGVSLRDINCGFKAYRREVVQDLDLTRNQHRFIPLLVAWKGYRVGEVPVYHRPRLYGRSRYGAGRMVIGLLSFARLILTPRAIMLKSRQLSAHQRVEDTIGEVLG